LTEGAREIPASLRRTYATALLLLAVGSLVLLWSYGLTWSTAEVPLIAGVADTTRLRELTGRDLLPGAAMAGWVSLAAVAGILATRSWGRTIVAGIGLLAGLVGAGAAVMFALAPTALVDANVGAGLGVGIAVTSSATAGWLVALVGGAAVVIASGWTLARGRQWPTLGSRYERRTRSTRAVSAWDAQDLGQDPTDDLVE
jgi:Tryptophan-associated transmembrane protein (Trp_oprn_chp)